MEFHRGDQKVERTKEIAIVDASVVVKWFVEEEDTAKALEMRSDYREGKVDLRSPQLMAYEVLNALRYNPELGEDDLARAGDALSKFQIVTYPLLGELKDLCLAAALKLGISIYDASYLSVGELLDRPVYTADERLIAKARGRGKVLHLKDYGR